MFTRRGTEVLNDRTALLGFSNDLKKSSLDLYVAVCSLYRQRRQNNIHNGNVDDLSTFPSDKFSKLEFISVSTNEEISTKI